VQENQGYRIGDLLEFVNPEYIVDPRRGFGKLGILPWAKDDVLAVRRELRGYLEEWINSGYLADGSEEPHARNFGPKSVPGPNGPELVPAPRALLAIAKLWNGRLEPLPGYPERNTDGTHVVFSGRGGQPTGHLSVIIEPKGGIQYVPGSMQTPDVETIAALFFSDFYNSEWAQGLMLCRGCKTFAIPNQKPRLHYVSGWHCLACSRKASARRSVEKSREAFKSTWLALAVAACQSWDAKPGRADRIQWITQRVNEGFEALKSKDRIRRIKRHTITRNLMEIEERARQKQQGKHST
jgi:hypothetical protein